jgi:hypothetical protein
MRESNSEGVATHAVPESCVGAREDAGEALTGAHAGWDTELRNREFRVRTLWTQAERNTRRRVSASAVLGPAESTTPCTHGTSLYGNREILWWPARWKAGGDRQSPNREEPVMEGYRKSDRGIVPGKWLNNAHGRAAEAVEGRPSDQGEHEQGRHEPDAAPENSGADNLQVYGRRGERRRRPNLPSASALHPSRCVTDPR